MPGAHSLCLPVRFCNVIVGCGVRLKGVPEADVPMIVNRFLDMLMLSEHSNKLASIYSGGNKRKLALAIALIGNPKIVLLDGIRLHAFLDLCTSCMITLSLAISSKAAVRAS